MEFHVTMWPWPRMPKAILDGLRAAELAALGPLSAWLLAHIHGRRAENDDGDLAQAVCVEFSRMMETPGGRLLLREVGSFPNFLETLATRLRLRCERSDRRYRAAVSGFVPTGRVSDPADRLEADELSSVIAREIARLTPVAREILRLHFDGMSRRAIARLLWHRAVEGGADRVKTSLETTRDRIRVALDRTSAAELPPRPRKRGPKDCPGLDLGTS